MTKKERNTTPVMIYKEDHEKLVDMCKKNEPFRDKIHELVEAHLKKK
jgi:hypothetical protein